MITLILIYYLISVIVYILTLIFIDKIKEIGAKIKNIDYKSLQIHTGILLIIGLVVYLISLIPAGLIFEIFSVIKSMINKMRKND